MHPCKWAVQLGCGKGINFIKRLGKITNCYTSQNTTTDKDDSPYNRLDCLKINKMWMKTPSQFKLKSKAPIENGLYWGILPARPGERLPPSVKR